MLKSEMLECLISYYSDGNKAKFSAQIGVKPQTVSAWIARNTFDAEVLYANCSDISADWLLNNGVDGMLKSGNNTATANNGSIAFAENNNHGNIGCTSDKMLYERIKHLEELLAEKERLMVLMERK